MLYLFSFFFLDLNVAINYSRRYNQRWEKKWEMKETYSPHRKPRTLVSIVRHNVFHRIACRRVRNKQDRREVPYTRCNESTQDGIKDPICSQIRQGCRISMACDTHRNPTNTSNRTVQFVYLKYKVQTIASVDIYRRNLQHLFQALPVRFRYPTRSRSLPP